MSLLFSGLKLDQREHMIRQPHAMDPFTTDDTEALTINIGGESHSTSMQCIPIQDHPYSLFSTQVIVQRKSSPTQPLMG